MKIKLLIYIFIPSFLFAQNLKEIQSPIFQSNSFKESFYNNLKISSFNDLNNSLFNRNYNLSKPILFEDQTKTNLDYNKVAIASVGLVGLFTWFHYYQTNAWWKDQRTIFHIQNDPIYALKIDKIGHFYGGYTGSNLGIGISKWVGFDKKSSAWIGSGIGSLWELYVEFEDGFGKQWGFSPSDATFDVFGGFYPAFQEFFEPLKSINVKYSYAPSEGYRTGYKNNFIDDYEGQTYWVTVNVFDFLSKETQDSWLKNLQWLQIAFGYGLRNWAVKENNYAGYQNADRELYIALDYSFVKLIKLFPLLEESETAYTIAKALDQLHFPAPALRITFPEKGKTSVIMYGFYFSN